jgi:hypothetical protein
VDGAFQRSGFPVRMTGFPSAVSNFQIIRCCGLLYSIGRHCAIGFSLFKFRLVDGLTKILSLCRRVHIHGARHRFSGRGEEIPAGRPAGCPGTEEQSQVLGWKLVRKLNNQKINLRLTLFLEKKISSTTSVTIFRNILIPQISRWTIIVLFDVFT